MAGAFLKYIWRPVKNSLTEYRTAQIKFTKKVCRYVKRSRFWQMNLIVANESDSIYIWFRKSWQRKS